MEVDDNSNEFPSFFKIILEPRNDLQQLGIPKKFITDNGTDLTDVVSLVVPTGKTWKVKLHQENGRAWFRDGWPEFVEYYSICHGHFLMFTYATMSVFKVCIFDTTASEIEYPLNPSETRSIQKEVSNTTTKTKSTSPSSSTQETGMVALVRKYRRKSGILTHDDIKKINSYEFENPSFAVIMQPSYVKFNFCLNVPSVFAAKYIENIQGGFTLQTRTGDNTWLVRCIGNTPKCKKFSVGWKEFALDNKLQVGDLCVFELVKAAEWLFKVKIIRCSSSVDVDDDTDVAYLSSSTISPNVDIEVILIDD